MRRWVHFDFKGAPFKVNYILDTLNFLKNFNINGILLEWEDMFPFVGRLASAKNLNAYAIEEVEKVLFEAKKLSIEVVPLVQTFSHLEWILKLKEFSHLRDDKKFPQVICVAKNEAWELIQDMIDQVAQVHLKFGMSYFHIGADEIFNMGVCEEFKAKINNENSRERAILWHITRTAKYLKDKYSLSVQVWHDMLEHVMKQDIIEFDAQNILEPMLWSYAEDLDIYLESSTWMALKPFKNIWIASAFKGANGPMSYASYPLHYVKNHESWTNQMTNFYKDFDHIQGLIFTGWSRYDHFAILCEIFPVGIPSLMMSIETIMSAQKLNGYYPQTYKKLSCNPPDYFGYVKNCKFPGSRIYELVNEIYSKISSFEKYKTSDFFLNGWLSNIATKYSFSSFMYIQKVLPIVNNHYSQLKELKDDLKKEMSKIFFTDTFDEFAQTYIDPELNVLKKLYVSGNYLLQKRYFFRRPFINASVVNY